MGFPDNSVDNPLAMQEIPGREDSLKKEMTTLSSILAWDIPWTEESGGLKSLQSQSSVQFSRSVVSDSLRPHESQHARPPRPSPTARILGVSNIHSDDLEL